MKSKPAKKIAPRADADFGIPKPAEKRAPKSKRETMSQRITKAIGERSFV